MPEYYLKDHLGSPRALCDHTGELMSLRDYYAFGKAWEKPNAAVVSDLYRYNGKEEQTVGGAGLLDFGARFYNVDIGRWLTQDPMAPKYPAINPYVFCLDNPIRFVDPDGRIIDPESTAEWARLKRDIEGRRNQLQKKLDSDSLSASEIANLEARVSMLTYTLSTMAMLEMSSQMYKLDSSHSGSGNLRYSGGVITINYYGTANFVHEVTHAGQFESGDILFDIPTGDVYGQDVYDEIAAYQAQWAYDPGSVRGVNTKVNSAADINKTWVQGIKINGEYIYTNEGRANTSNVPININSTRDDMYWGYPKWSDYKKFSANTPLKNMYPGLLYYKH